MSKSRGEEEVVKSEVVFIELDNSKIVSALKEANDKKSDAEVKIGNESVTIPYQTFDSKDVPKLYKIKFTHGSLDKDEPEQKSEMFAVLTKAPKNLEQLQKIKNFLNNAEKTEFKCFCAKSAKEMLTDNIAQLGIMRLLANQEGVKFDLAVNVEQSNVASLQQEHGVDKPKGPEKGSLRRK